MLFHKPNPQKLTHYLLNGSTSYLLHLFMSNSLLSGFVPANPWIAKSVHSSQIQEYLVFMLIVVFITLALQLFQRKSINTKGDDLECSSKIEDSRSWKLNLKAVIFYSFLYCFFTSIQHFFLKDDFANSNIIMDLNQENLLLSSRMLEEKNTTSQNPSISLSIGRVLSSLGMTAYNVILSKDAKTAFVSLDRSGVLQIVDVSSPENLVITNSLNLIPVEYPFYEKALTLSHDGKTLFASNLHRLEIIDVSRLETPVILGQFEDENIAKLLQDHYFTKDSFDYRVSMTLSGDNKTIFIGGMCFQIIDISDPKKPTLIFSDSEKINQYTFSPIQVQMSQNEEKLFIANGSLSIYNATNPRNLQLLGSYLIPHYSITSVVLSKKYPTELAFVLGMAAQMKIQQMIFQKINISDLTTLESYPFFKDTIWGTPHILGLGFNENIAFLQVWNDLMNQDVGIFDLQKKEFQMKGDASLIKKATSLVVLPGDESKIIVAQDYQKLSTIQFDTDFPNKRVFSFSKNPLANLITQNTLVIDSTILTADEKTLIVKRGSANDNNGALEVIDVSNYSNPVLLSSYNTTESIREIRYLEDAKKAVTIDTEGKMSLLDLSDLTKPTLIATFSIGEKFDYFSSIQFSSDGEKAYLTSRKTEEDNYLLSIFDLSDFSNGKILSQTQIDTTYKSILTKNSNIMILIGTRITSYDVSDPQTPIEISSIPGDLNRIFFAVLSSDEKFLYARVYASSAYFLRIYDISDLSAMKLLGNLFLPDAGADMERDMAFSSDNQRAYIGSEEGYILGINISNPSSPSVQETWDVGMTIDTSGIQLMKLSQDGKNMIYTTSARKLGIVELKVPYSLFLHTENIRLGQKYSESVPILQLEETQEYEVFDEDRRFLKASLLSVKINPSKKSPEINYIPFPYWMNFDKDNQIFAVEPKKQENLGIYTIYSAFSTKIPENTFNETLTMMLISFGYLDNQMYLTSRYERYEDFRIPEEYNSIKKDLFAILRGYYFEICTMFDILPSLDIAYEERISINTLSSDPIRVDVMFADKQNGFVNKQYGSIKPVVTEGKSRIILEGIQKEINNALELLVVNLENNKTLCDGTIVISDRLNPAVTKSFTNISKFFNINEIPKMEIPIQDQIDSTSISTGTYFTINFKNGTFIDVWNNELSIELINGDPGKSLPAWISYSNMSLRGTPPEEISWHDLKFNLLVKNEFKETKVPFTLNIKISPTFALKLLIKYSPYILTILGLIIHANKIYNICCKKRYRHPKDFYINVGEEISNQVVIPPVRFIWQEKQESVVIMKYLKESVAKELGKNPINNLELAEYFIVEDGLKINKIKMIKKIREVLMEIPKEVTNNKLRLYCKGAESSYQLINKVLFNQLTSYLLFKNQEVKRIFDQIKDSWADLVDWSTDGTCKINEGKLSGLLSDGSNGDYKKMEDNDSLDLLKDAIEGYAFSKQSLNYRAIQALIIIKEKTEANPLKRYLKLDLENVNFSDKGKMGYGMYYKIENDVLSLYGIPEEKFVDKTVVIQITTAKHRILSEIWIHGVSKNRFNRILKGDESEVDEDFLIN